MFGPGRLAARSLKQSGQVGALAAIAAPLVIYARKPQPRLPYQQAALPAAAGGAAGRHFAPRANKLGADY